MFFLAKKALTFYSYFHTILVFLLRSYFAFKSDYALVISKQIHHFILSLLLIQVFAFDCVSLSRDAVSQTRDAVSQTRDTVSQTRDAISRTRDAVSRTRDAISQS
jgi:hypothetical protein